MSAAITVVGSLNMDFVVSTQSLPAPGATVLGTGFRMMPGGKGANQACAAARLAKSTPVRMIGCTGYDLFADHLKASLSSAGVDIRYVRATRSAPTGVALITVGPGGQNTIVVAPGANHALLFEDVEAMRPAFQNAAFVLLQLEIPLPTVEIALRLARRTDAMTMLDPAPAQPLRSEMLREVSLLTPNESEVCALLDRRPARMVPSEAADAARALLRRGPRAVVVKMGDRGCFYADNGSEIYCPAFPVEAVDATAAGDTFNAALAVAQCEGLPVADALRFANAAGAMSVTRAGAQASVPTRAEVEALLA
jgi:ribokinase